MKINLSAPKQTFNFCAQKHQSDEPGKVEYSQPYFLEQEKQAAKARIEEYINKNSSDEVLEVKGKKVFSKIANITEKFRKKLPLKH